MMLKKLIPAAALLALAAAAQAEVTPYGLLDVAYSKDSLDGKADLRSGGNSTTKVGLKGNQDLAAGLKATFQLEAGVNDKLQSTRAVFNRQAWAGLAGSFGEVRAGTQDSVRFQNMIGFDLNGAANVASVQGNLGLDTLSGRGNRSVQYISPSVSGFVAQVGHQLEYQGDKSTNAVAVSYTLDKLVLAVTAESKRSDADKATSSMGASYDFGVAKVAMSYAGAKTEGKGYMVGVVAPVAGFNVGVQVAKNTDAKANGTEFFVNKEIMRNTFAYADYVRLKDSSSKGNLYAVGAIYTF